MSGAQRTRVILHLASGVDPIQGELEQERRPLVPFRGWLQLVQGVSAALNATAMDEPQSEEGAE